MRLSEIYTHIYLAGIHTRDGHLCRNRCSPFGVYSQYIGVGPSNTYGSQAAKDVRSSQDTLLDIFERIGMFFRRLEMYMEVPLTTEMTNTIIQIMVEILSTLGIATKEIKQSRTSELFMYEKVTVTVDLTKFREIYEESDWKDRYGRRVEEAGQVDARGSSNGSCRNLEGDACC